MRFRIVEELRSSPLLFRHYKRGESEKGHRTQITNDDWDV